MSCHIKIGPDRFSCFNVVQKKTDKQSLNYTDSDLRIFGIHLTKHLSTGIIKSCFLNGIFTKEQKKAASKRFYR